MKNLLRILTFVLSVLVFSSTSFAAEATKRLLIIGDSLTEGYGISKNAAYPALLEKKIQQAGKNWVVINAGVSGATTASGLPRLKWQLKSKPDILILALGANDGLRGLELKGTEKNLSDTIELAQKEKITVVIAGMMLPPNYGADYRKKFESMYEALAKKYKLKKIPFLLEGVAGDPKLNLEDGIHPNEAGHKVMADVVYNSIKDLL